MSTTPKPSKPENPGNGASDRSAGHPVPAPDGVDQHNEDPRARAERLGQGDVVNPGVPTGQTPEQMRDELIPDDSNEQFRIAADKRADAARRDEIDGKTGRDERGFTERG
jgi:hypothetical protein